MTWSSERQETRRDQRTRIRLLDSPLRRYRVNVVLELAPTSCTEDAAHLYWFVQGLGPIRADVDERGLSACFARYAPSAEVAAWEVAGEVRALPGAVLAEVEVRRHDTDIAEFVLTRSASPASEAEAAA